MCFYFSQGCHRVSLLPEQLLLHPSLVAAHVLPRQLPRRAELDLQCGSVDPDGAWNRLRVLRRQQDVGPRVLGGSDEEDGRGNLHGHGGLLLAANR